MGCTSQESAEPLRLLVRIVSVMRDIPQVAWHRLVGALTCAD